VIAKDLLDHRGTVIRQEGDRVYWRCDKCTGDVYGWRYALRKLPDRKEG
jgi:hypothetical protein